MIEYKRTLTFRKNDKGEVDRLMERFHEFRTNNYLTVTTALERMLECIEDHPPQIGEIKEDEELQYQEEQGTIGTLEEMFKDMDFGDSDDGF